jgi:glycosyltransferase involved in cell wall biosynthesis
MAFDACLVIPVYEHAEPLRAVLPALRPLGLPCLLVDDGSSSGCADALRALAREHAGWVRLRRLDVNQGKGGAVQAGLRWAAELGHSHALQLDADGQHDLASLPALLAESQARPAAVVCADPVFDASAPAARRAGRRLSNFWIAVNTLSLDIPDGMCGLRVYPVAPAVALADAGVLGRRMDFDTEILVRLHWQGLELRFLPVKVHYPDGGHSNFQGWRDNRMISAMHARLFFGMLWRAPRLLWRRLR